MTQYAYPAHIKQADMDPAPPALPGFCDAEDYRELFLDGRIESDSFLATPEHGERLAKGSAACVAKDFMDLLKEA